ncbi:MAG: aspartate kinase [Ruminococcaceae bacterium]|nr:aspartate kinase [Oscillospiraceae bacterium]MBR3596767.1 aspartate kinase [Clostridia bacterium]
MLKVVKFGGSSLADANQFRKVAEIIKSDDNRRYVVASAPGKRDTHDVKVTDLLLQCFRLVRDKKSIDETFDRITERYNGIIRDLGIDFSLEEDLKGIKVAILHHASQDYIASRGEYLNSKILANFLGFPFIDAEEGIFFDEKGVLDLEKTDKELGRLLSYHEYAVVPGFYGATPSGMIKTFSRGGSDITGSIVARAANADIYENWTDVSGMLMADPRCIENPKPIPEITYRELRELSYMGATVLHDEAIFPVRNARIPINIRNTNCPEAPGTMIVHKASSNNVATVITGIAGKKGITAIHVEKDMMNSELGFGRKVLEVLENHGVSFEHLPSGIDTMSVLVSNDSLGSHKGSITADIVKKVNPDSITLVEGLCLVAVVGRGMVNTEGTAARIFTALANAKVNIRMIDQGSSEINIIIAVDDKDYQKTLQAIYDEFVK